VRSLTLKLTAAFLVVGLAGAGLVAAFVGRRTRSEFDRFMAGRERVQLVDDLAAYYESAGSWEGIGRRVPGPAFGSRRLRDLARGQVVLADASGTVIVGPWFLPPGESLPPADRELAAPIEVDGETVGYVLAPGRGPPPPVAAALEASFLARFNQAILLGAAGATAVALLLGILLARTISRPVRELTAATHAVARGELGRQVAVGARDELGELAASFNRMSADLAEASRLRRQLTADIAHDLRTPLTVILGYTEGLADGKFQGKPEVYERMHGEALHLRRLIDDLRTLSLADAGELPLQRQPCDPRSLLDRAAAAHAPLAAAKGVAIRVSAPPDLPPAYADPERIAQVLGNLVGNALRHTPAGGTIELSAARGAGGVLLRVADDGEGIAPEDLTRIFERHFRVDAARARDDGASGLGLAIARSIVEAHGGAITVESAPGAGSVFTITVPGIGDDRRG